MRTNEYILYDNIDTPIIKAFHSIISPIKRTYNAHHHTECELSLFIEGHGIYSASQKNYEFNSGDVFLFGSNEEHCITEVYEKADLLNIHFEPRILWEQSENIELLKLFSARSKTFSNQFSCSDNTLANHIVSLENELIHKHIGYRINVRCLLLSALIHIMRNYPYTNSHAVITGAHSTEQLKRAMQYIDANLANKLTLKEISETAYMAPTYFSSVFKKFNGITPWEYITIKRVEKAIELLESSNMTKLEISEKCGFSSTSNFYKAFSRITGKSPKEFKKKQQY